MKLQLGIISLVLVLVYSQNQNQQECQTTTLGPEEFPKQVTGDWVLVWLTYNNVTSGTRRFDLMKSSYITVRIYDHTIKILERNVVPSPTGERSCVSFDFNLTFADSSDGVNQLDMHRTEVVVDGKKISINSTSRIQFLPAAENTMQLLFRNDNKEDMLAVYRRDGHYMAPVQNLEEIRASAQCAGVTGPDFREWNYDRHSDFCHKSVLPSLGPGQLQQTQGDWVVVALVYDQVKSQGRQIPLMTSSHISVQNKDDHLEVLEHNTVGGCCASYPFNVPLPPSGSDQHRLLLHRTKWFLNGVEKSIDENGTVEFFSAPPHTFRVLYRGKDQTQEDFFVMYRREGHHRGNLQQDLEDHRAKATQLGLSGGDYTEWLYGGSEDFCHKTVKVQN